MGSSGGSKCGRPISSDPLPCLHTSALPAPNSPHSPTPHVPCLRTPLHPPACLRRCILPSAHSCLQPSFHHTPAASLTRCPHTLPACLSPPAAAAFRESPFEPVAVKKLPKEPLIDSGLLRPLREQRALWRASEDGLWAPVVPLAIGSDADSFYLVTAPHRQELSQ